MEPLSKFVAGILALIFIILVPVEYIQIHKHDVYNDHVTNETISLFNQIKKQGYLSVKDYESFLNKISITGELYNIEINHAIPSSANSLAKLFSEDLIASNNDIIPNNNIGILSSHKHTDACYAGHRHNESGCTSINYYSGPPIQFKCIESISGYNQNRQRTITYYINCMRCNNSLGSVTLNDWENDNITYPWNNSGDYFTYSHKYMDANNKVVLVMGQPVYMFLTSNYDDGTGWTKVSENYYRKINPEFSTYYNHFIGLYRKPDELVLEHWLFFGYKMEYSCPYCMQYGYISKTLTSMWSCGQDQDETPICNQVVTNIAATNPYQEVAKGQNIITTANATYLDGHTAIVNCTSNFNPNKLGLQTVTLTYNGLVYNAKTSGSITCNISVNVIDNLPELLYIAVSPEIQNIIKYENPSFSVRAYYSDGSAAQVFNYNISGLDVKKIGEQIVTISYTDNKITKSSNVIVVVYPMQKTCNICGYTYDLDENDFDRGCPICRETIDYIFASPNNISLHKGNALNITVYAKYKDGHISPISGWGSDYDPNKLGFQTVKITYLEHSAYITVTVYNMKSCNICGLEYELNYDGSDPGCPVCSTTIVAITASPTYQTVNFGNDMELTVTATYKDGHLEVINDWTSDFQKNQAGLQRVTIKYRHLFVIVTVDVLDYDNIACPICNLSYSKKSSPLGCPECYYTLVSIYPSLADGGNKSLFGNPLNLKVVLLFRDGHFAITYDDWSCDNFNPYQLGVQDLVIKASDKFGNIVTSNLIVEVVERVIRKVCPNGHIYYLSGEEEDAGCPYCILSEAEIKEFFEMKYTGEIISELYQNGRYVISPGDYITIKVIKIESKSFFDFFFYKRRNKKIVYGGVIL